MPAIYHEGSWLGNATDPEVLVKDTVGWTGKNLLPEPDLSSASGVTFTKNSDGSITTNGSATARVQKNFASESNTHGLEKLIGKEVVLSGCPVGGTNATYRLNAYFYDGTHQLSYSDVGEGIAFMFPDIKNTYTQWNIKLDINAGGSASVDVSGKVFFPMLRKADITDPTYEPYHESVEEEIEQIYADNGVLGAKNKFAYPWATKSATLGGITFTDNDGYSLTVNGTATSNTQFDFFNASNRMGGLETGRKYILSGAPETSLNTNDAKLQLTFRDSNDTASSQITVVCPQGGEIEFTIPEGYRPWYFVYYVRSGVTINNLVVKPMLRLASDPDDTYQPYAMTNRELTEKVTEVKNAISVVTITANSNLNDYYKTGDYYSNTASNTATLTNKPSDLTGAFRLSVICAGYPIGEGSNASNVPITQKIELVNGATPAIYMRHKSGGSDTYGSWYKFTGTVVS